ncbi:hypothetical protein H9649_13810 [Sporosarcina sp. Sa2YVA2]|uniref:Uncharacterized protein n=1 Tax=Sporosarcina quadrami TaxID=2762234 RepID=A0ABR8UCD6_9BACL|nr:hypothetical protein [Sporosarcina quadrami]MBD7985666.1 hypothetical protein [Sporosarcina quadrami]
MKRFLYFFGWTIVLGIMIYLGAKYQFFLKQEYMKNFRVGSFVWFSAIFPIVIGMLLRSPKLINEIKDKRPWTFDWAKFIGIGLPSMFISLAFVLIFYVPGNILQLFPQQIYLGNPTIQTIAGVVFGFVLLDSLKKE